MRERREYVLPARFDDTPLPGLLSDVSYVDLRGRGPQEFAAMIAAKLAGLGVGPSSSPGEAGRGPLGGIPVSEADPRRLGVHAAISVPGVQDEVPPEYVPRDVDAAESGVRAKVAAAAARGGFVLLVGGSSVGKTRCAEEAVKALLPDWWLVHPAGPAEVAALARAPSPRMMVWLDELQGYLGGHPRSATYRCLRFDGTGQQQKEATGTAPRASVPCQRIRATASVCEPSAGSRHPS